MKRPVAISASLFLTISLSALAADWPQWRGPLRTGLSAEKGLLNEWPEGGPKVIWKAENLGDAYASVAVANGRVFTQGNVDGEGRIQCYDEKNGDLLWSVHPPTEKAVFTHGKGDGPRGTPTVDGDYVYCEGGEGSLTCLKADSGAVVWTKHLVEDFGGKRPGWGFSESPLVDGDQLIVTPGGGQGAIVALDKLTGKVLWKSTEVTDAAHYCSAIAADIEGQHQIIQFTRERVVGVDAKDGSLLWKYANSANKTANVATPIVKGDYVFSSSAYGTGGGLVQINADGDEFTAEEVYFQKPMANHHGGIVLVGDHLYGFGSGGLICMDLMTGDIAWRNRSVGKGSLCYADGLLYCFGEKNEMAIVEATPKEYIEHGRFETADSGKPTWAHPVVANGRMYLRDQDTLIVYDVSGK
jgi:outer membrane protein assembly factor BamB